MTPFFLCHVLGACLGHLARRAALLLALCALWPVLTASAPPAQACTEASAAFVLRQAVEREVISNGAPISVPAGYAVAWSCVSIDEAQAELTRRIADVK
jgi:hypothetical protein